MKASPIGLKMSLCPKKLKDHQLQSFKLISFFVQLGFYLSVFNSGVVSWTDSTLLSDIQDSLVCFVF